MDRKSGNFLELPTIRSSPSCQKSVEIVARQRTLASPSSEKCEGSNDTFVMEYRLFLLYVNLYHILDNDHTHILPFRVDMVDCIPNWVRGTFALFGFSCSTPFSTLKVIARLFLSLRFVKINVSVIFCIKLQKKTFPHSESTLKKTKKT